jgi:hypothetical protein
VWGRWWHGEDKKRRRDDSPADETEEIDPQKERLLLGSQAFEQFLHTLGARLDECAGEVRLTLLQRSRNYDAFYRVDLVAGHPHLLVLLPQAHLLQFEGYLVQFHLTHPLFGIMVPLISEQGSAAFEQGRRELEEQMLFTLAEAMKSLFWAGMESGQFPPEIRVERLRFEALDPQG